MTELLFPSTTDCGVGIYEYRERGGRGEREGGRERECQPLVLQERRGGESDMFQYFSTILYVHFRNSTCSQPQGVEISVLPTLQINSWIHTILLCTMYIHVYLEYET
jgi:hypothetical protein